MNHISLGLAWTILLEILQHKTPWILPVLSAFNMCKQRAGMCFYAHSESLSDRGILKSMSVIEKFIPRKCCSTDRLGKLALQRIDGGDCYHGDKDGTWSLLELILHDWFPPPPWLAAVAVNDDATSSCNKDAASLPMQHMWCCSMHLQQKPLGIQSYFQPQGPSWLILCQVLLRFTLAWSNTPL